MSSFNQIASIFHLRGGWDKKNGPTYKCAVKSELPRSMISWRGGHRSRSRVKSCHSDLVGCDEPFLSCRYSSALTAIIFQLIPNIIIWSSNSYEYREAWILLPQWLLVVTPILVQVHLNRVLKTCLKALAPVKIWLFYPFLLKTMSNWEIERCPTDKFCLMRHSSWGDYTKMRREVCYND